MSWADKESFPVNQSPADQPRSDTIGRWQREFVVETSIESSYLISREYMKRLVVADVNETILPAGHELPSQETIDVVGEMQARGIALAPVSSLSVPLIKDFAAALNLRGMGILDGGATIYDFTAGERDKDLSRWLAPQPTLELVSAIGHMCDKIYYDAASTLRTPDTIDLSEITEPTPSVFAIFKSELQLTIEGLVRANMAVGAQFNTYEGQQHLGCLQITCAGVDKASGVKILTGSDQYRDIRGKEMAAIADGLPDIALFEAMPPGTLKIAMLNGSELLKAKADVIAPRVDQGGFVTAMREYILRQPDD